MPLRRRGDGSPGQGRPGTVSSILASEGSARLRGCCDDEQAAPAQQAILGDTSLKRNVISARIHPAEQVDGSHRFAAVEVHKIAVHVIGAEGAIAVDGADVVSLYAPVAKYQPYLLAASQRIERDSRGGVIGQQPGHPIEARLPILRGSSGCPADVVGVA